MSDQTTPVPSTPPSRVDRGLAAPGRRSFIVGGSAMLAALGLSPDAGASPRTASLPDAAPGASNSRLQRWARDTWHSLDAMTDPATGLPADNIPESLAPAERSGYTSPTNIGGYMWSAIVARELGIISAKDCSARLLRTLQTLNRMEHHEPSGMYYNWYDEATGDALRSWPKTGDPVYPFVSSVDSGWLGAALLVVKNADPVAGRLAGEIFDRMRWDAFYNPGDGAGGHPTVRPGGLMHGGFFVFDHDRPGGVYRGTHIGGDPVWLTTHHYDTIVSETRITSYLGILTGQVPGKHYYAPWRTFPASCDWSWHEMQPVGETRTYLGIDVYEGAYTYRGMHVVPGWGGSMFEELMPAVFVPEEKWAPRSWGVNHPLHVRAEREHGLRGSRLRLLGLLTVERPLRQLPRVRRGRPRDEPGRVLLRPREDQLRPRLRRLPRGDQPEPHLRRRRGHPARVVPGDDVRARRRDGEPDQDPDQARCLRQGWLLRRGRRAQRHDREALPLARPGHGHGRAGQRARQGRAAHGRSAPRTSRRRCAP